MEIREGHNKFYINDKQGKQIAEIVFVKNEILSHYALLRNMNLIKRGSMMIFAVDGRVQSHDIFHSLRDVMQESI